MHLPPCIATSTYNPCMYIQTVLVCIDTQDINITNLYIYILEVFKAQILSSCLKVSISRGVALPCFQAGPTSLKELRGGGVVLWLSLHDTHHDTPFLSQSMPTACFHYQFCHGWAHPIPTPVQKWHARQVVLCNFETASTRFMSICQSMIKYVK